MIFFYILMQLQLVGCDQKPPWQFWIQRLRLSKHFLSVQQLPRKWLPAYPTLFVPSWFPINFAIILAKSTLLRDATRRTVLKPVRHAIGKNTFFPGRTPGVSRSTTKPVNALFAEAFGSGFVRARTKYQFACPALVIHIFCPVIT